MKHPNAEILIALAEGRPIQAQFEASPWSGMDTFKETHGKSPIGDEYRAVIRLIEAHGRRMPA